MVELLLCDFWRWVIKMPYTSPGSLGTQQLCCKEFQLIGNPKQTVVSLIEKNLGLWIIDIAESLGQSNAAHQPGEWAILIMESTVPRQAALADAESTDKHPCCSLSELQLHKQNKCFYSSKSWQYNQFFKLCVRLDCDFVYMCISSLH